VYSNAGHDWPLVIDYSSGKIRPLEATGFLIGAFGEIEPDEHSSEIQPEDAVVFYTDGVTEAFNSQHELYGVHRLETVLKRNTWKSAEQILSAILADIEIFTHGEPQSDDLTMLAIKRKEGRS
jgi:sigma-B regulation protein RsbU (phosphoserine phosphatase)